MIILFILNKTLESVALAGKHMGPPPPTSAHRDCKFYSQILLSFLLPFFLSPSLAVLHGSFSLLHLFVCLLVFVIG